MGLEGVPPRKEKKRYSVVDGIKVLVAGLVLGSATPVPRVENDTKTPAQISVESNIKYSDRITPISIKTTDSPLKPIGDRELFKYKWPNFPSSKSIEDRRGQKMTTVELHEAIEAGKKFMDPDKMKYANVHTPGFDDKDIDNALTKIENRIERESQT